MKFHIRSRISIFLFYGILILFPAGASAQTWVRIDRPSDPWGFNLGWEHPGIKAEYSLHQDPQRSPCRKYAYDFTEGGQYLNYDIAMPAGDPKAVRFDFYVTSPCKPFINLVDDTGQHFRIFFDAPKLDTWQTIEIPLQADKAAFHHSGANDGQFHTPIKGIGLGVERTGLDKGYYMVGNWCADMANPAKASPLRIRLCPRPDNGVAFRNEEAVCDIRLDNRLPTPQTVQLEIDIVNEQKQPLAHQTKELTLQPYEETTYPLPISTNEPGYQLITVRASAAGLDPIEIISGFAVVLQPQRYGEKDPTSFFGMCGAYPPAIGTATRMGVKRDLILGQWNNIEPKEGLFRWDSLEELTKYNLVLDVKLNNYIMPDWAFWKDAENPKFRNYPKPEVYGKWVYEYVKHYGDQIHSVDLINEPDLGYWNCPNLPLEEAVQLYSDTLKAGYEAAKRANPNINVCGIGVSTFDMMTGFRFTKGVLAKAGQYVDEISNHSYPNSHHMGMGRTAMTPEEGEIVSRSKQTLDLLAEVGKPRRMSIGELGWCLHLDEPLLGEVSLRHAAFTAQAHILASSIPEMEYVIWFNFWGGPIEAGGMYTLLRGDPQIPTLYPIPSACTYATCAAVMDHTKPVGPINVGPSVYAHRFDREDADTSVVALWSRDAKIRLQTKAPEDAKVLNSFGREIAAGANLDFELDILPVYIITPKAGAKNLAAWLKHSRIKAADPVRLQRAYLATNTNLQLVLFNCTNEPVKVTAEAFGQKHALVAKPGKSAVSFELYLPLSPGRSRAGDQVSLLLPSGKQSVTFQAALTPITFLGNDGTPDEKLQRLANATTPLVRETRDDVLPPDPNTPWDNADDLSSKTYLGWDEKNLYIQIDVTDDIHSVNATGQQFWEYDSIQIAVDSRNDSTVYYDDNDREFGLVLGAEQAVAWRTHYPPLEKVTFPAFRAERDESTKITRYLVAIPWSDLNIATPAAGKVVSLNVVIIRDDVLGRTCWGGLTRVIC